MEDSKFIFEVHNFEAVKPGDPHECKHCGDSQHSRRHPHTFWKKLKLSACVCDLPRSALVHQMTRV